MNSDDLDTTTAKDDATPPAVPPTATPPTATPYVFVVTGLVSAGEQCSPRVVGIFSTKAGAVQAARAFFATYANSYKDGAFVKDSKVVGRQDFSSILPLSGGCPSVRILLEVYHPGVSEGGDCVIAAVNAVQCNTTTDQGIALLDEASYRSSKDYNSDTYLGPLIADEEPSAFGDLAKEQRKLRVLMSGEHHDGERNPSLLGVYFSKQAALEAAKHAYSEHRSEDEIYEVEKDKTETVGDRGLVMSYDMGPVYGIALDTFVLDQARSVKENEEEGGNDDDSNDDDSNDDGGGDYDGDDMELELLGGGLYFNPLVYYEEVENDEQEEKEDGGPKKKRKKGRR
jgi:hypothetical protein